MKTLRFILLIIGCSCSFILFAQTEQDSTVIIHSKNIGKISGKFISESRDSIKLYTEDLGIFSIAKSEIIYENRVAITTKDGNVFIGTIEEEDQQKVVLKTANIGQITISKMDIIAQRIVDSKQMKGGEFWGPNPHSSRYFWMPNAYGLKKGEGYYQNIWVLWNQFDYGITDNFSLGAGIIPLFLFSGSSTPIFATAKLSIPVSEEFSLGGGAMLGTVVGEEEGLAGIFYGMSTFGSRDNNLTLGVGYGFTDEDWADAPMISLSGIFRVSKRTYVLTENYYLSGSSDTALVVSIGGRSIIKRAALDYGLVIPIGVDAGIAIPWLGFTIPLGKG